MAELINELTWSASRDNLFHSCERAYYYNYYGSWGGWGRYADKRTRQLYILKNITTLEMWAGSIVHETIAEALNRHARMNDEIRVGELQARARQKLRSGWVDAVNKTWLKRPKNTNLHRLYYGNGQTLEREQTEMAKSRVYDCLAAFCESEILQQILSVPYMAWKPIDQLDSFMLDGLKVWCAVDFAFTDPAGLLQIIDWKTGAEKPEAMKIQLGCYAFFAREKWQAEPERIRLKGIFLRENARASEYAISPESLVETRETILASAAEMRARLVNVDANQAREEDFPICDNDWVCSRCNFREVCPKIQ
jgi:hypothetical protein